MNKTVYDYKLIPLNSNLMEVQIYYPISPTEELGVFKWEEQNDIIHFKFSKDKLVEVIYNLDCNRESDEALTKKVNVIFDFYDNCDWEQILDNGFGLIFNSKIKNLRGLWSYMCDVVTIKFQDI